MRKIQKITCSIKVQKLAFPIGRSRRLFRIDAIGIWVLTGKSIEEWLKINRKLRFLLGSLRFGGVHHSGGGSRFFVFLDAADKGGLEIEHTEFVDCDSFYTNIKGDLRVTLWKDLERTMAELLDR